MTSQRGPPLNARLWATREGFTKSNMGWNLKSIPHNGNLKNNTCTPLKFNSLPLKNGGWKTTFPTGNVTFQGRTVKLQGSTNVCCFLLILTSEIIHLLFPKPQCMVVFRVPTFPNSASLVNSCGFRHNPDRIPILFRDYSPMVLQNFRYRWGTVCFSVSLILPSPGTAASCCQNGNCRNRERQGTNGEHHFSGCWLWVNGNIHISYFRFAD